MVTRKRVRPRVAGGARSAAGPGRVLALVMARGGSKGLPGKNVRPLAGHPLVAWSIAAARAARSVTRTVLTTDDPVIAELGRRYGAEAPFLRPADLATDTAPDFPVVVHALDWLRDTEGFEPEIVVQLRPTSPFRPRGLVDAGVAMLRAHPDADSVRGVVPSGQNPYKMWRQHRKGHLEPLLGEEFDEPYNMPRQQLPATFWQTGHIDVIRLATIRRRRSLTGDRVYPLLIDPRFQVDIDSESDWRYAEWRLAREPLSIERPGAAPRALPAAVRLLVLDFDGVVTDNRVWMNEREEEWVACDRGDGRAMSVLPDYGVPVMVLSTEKHGVVAARCRKLGVECEQAVEGKAAALRKVATRRGIPLSSIVYAGNDLNDLDCLGLAGFGVAVADAHPGVRAAADLVLSRPGGRGAVRELVELLLRHITQSDNVNVYATRGPGR